MAPAVNQAHAECEPPRYFLRSHARQVSQEHVTEKRKLEARGKSSGKMRRLWSPPEQAQPTEDPASASPGQHCSQGLPHAVQQCKSWRCQLRAAKQQLRQCQTKLAEFRKKTAKYERQQQSLQRLSDREKLIIDQCVMKANAKSARAVRYKKDWLYDCLLLKSEVHICEKLLTSPESERRGVLMFDEMSVRKSLHVRESDMKVVVIDAVTCDNSTTNRCALRSLGIRGDMKDQQVSFQHPCDPSKVISAIIDPPHIFKCIRNNLQKVGKFLLPQGREVYHDHYAALLEYEEQQSGLRAVPKLTRAHIYPNAFQKMSVKLAVQLFSESTATAMIFYSEQESCKKLHGSAGTSEFTRQMNRLFDFIDTERGNLMVGQVLQIHRKSAKAKAGFRYVLVGKFGQDPLERFFGIIRHVAGDGGQPTVQQFLFIYRMLSVRNLVQPPQRASVVGDGPQLLLKLQDLFQKEKPAACHVSKNILTGVERVEI
ncbi:hypothetical protein MRX96_025800 [Rhipicephalus microplus]